MDDLIPLPSYAPDGLTEQDIDVMIAEYFVTAAEQNPESPRPAAIADRVATHRHMRRNNRQTVNSALRARPDAAA
ncbi:hypothetical protein [Amycolatopsis sp. NBC_01286]|uniref:hypothetical protein n=1 Tax=Amycolatopsis sp. NBC_01286 TaxID=2903560 RepID=UPI002E145B28|nr:hypothetical protein OG570_14365 [Amycolatopsis sp. NBC_01286]